jgi:hypothetical protein
MSPSSRTPVAFLSHFPAEAGAAAWMLLFADDLVILQDTSTPGADF